MADLIYGTATWQDIKKFFKKQPSYFYKKGEIIVRFGDMPSGIHFIKHGNVKVYSLTEAGEQNLHFIYQPGEIFPLMWIFNDRRPHVYYEALTKVEIKRSTRLDFQQFIESDITLTLAVGRYMAEIIRALYERINTLQLTNSYVRLLTQLLIWVNHFGTGEEKVKLHVPLTQQDIADSINVTRETASKELHTLASRGLITYKGKAEIVINNISKIKEELAQYYDSK